MKKILGYTLLSFISIVVFLLIVIPLNAMRSIDGVKDYFLIIAPIYSFFFFGVLVFLYPRILFKFKVRKEFYFFKKERKPTIILTIGIFAIVYFLILVLVREDFGFYPENLGVLLTGVQAPLLEEVIFRGYLLHTFIERNTNKYLALVVVSTIFGGIHGINYLLGAPITFTYIVGVIAGGILLGAIYIKYGLWSSIIVHYLWNNAGNIFLKTNDLEEKGIVTILIIIISLVILFGKKRRRGYRLSR